MSLTSVLRPSSPVQIPLLSSLSEAKLSLASSELFTLGICRSHMAAMQEEPWFSRHLQVFPLGSQRRFKTRAWRELGR